MVHFVFFFCEFSPLLTERNKKAKRKEKWKPQMYYKVFKSKVGLFVAACSIWSRTHVYSSVQCSSSAAARGLAHC